ncbi:MAG TPA: glycosyltransferase N-terminal domain-containing protein [Phycisphaerales bacterium]|nr:glycosyltransferase N-terminal domain-containing protein [Phycisphaerales bacterium]
MNLLDVGYGVAAVATAPWWARKARGGWAGRLGHVGDLAAPTPGRPRVLMHAVSVGEVGAIRALVPLLIGSGAEVIVSVGTDTGFERARALFAPPDATGPGAEAAGAPVVQYPLDFSRCVARFLDVVRPDLVALVELEVWPNFVRACRGRGIPVAVINGRLSERSRRGYGRVGRWVAPMFRSLAMVAAQDEAYRGRFIELGVDPGRCVVTGTMKWDSVRAEAEVPGAAALAAALGIDPGRPLIVAGSTGPGEEVLLHGACPPGAQLLCAPRRPERFDEAAAMLPGCVRRSRRGGAAAEAPGRDRFLLDSIGELRAAYALADVVVLGRSFYNLYGSDPGEPAGLGKPIVAGPRMGDFATMAADLERSGGLVRTDAAGVSRLLRDLVGDAARREGLGRRARECVIRNRGASARTCALLAGLLGETVPGTQGAGAA